MDEINRIRPDLLILSGDVLDRRENLSVLDAFLTGIDATQVIATLGNWEYWGDVDLKALQSVYTKHGASLLVNREKLFELKGRKVRITGLDDFTAGAPREELLTVPSNADVSILVEHSPGFFESPKVTSQAADVKEFNLCLSGHTHAGQVTLLGWPLWTPVGSGSFVSGWYNTPICQLYISRGIGSSVIPARFFARPEIAVFEL
jgi:predicted MPP superfamily phosphohydrolase